MNALVLAGGMGTRLRPLTDQTPKSLLPIANRPFLEHQVEHLQSHGVERIVLSLGYLPAAIRDHFGDRLEYAVEPEPLGTGGAIRFAARAAGFDRAFLVCNGDILTDLDLTALHAFHRERGAVATIALTPVADPSRYGLVTTSPQGAVTAFVEKPPAGTAAGATINAGTYVLEPPVLDAIEPDRAVSIEYDVFPPLVGRGLYASSSDARWRDIGTPESYLSANLERMPAGGLVDPAALVDPSARVVDSVVGAAARIGAAAVVERSVVLPGVEIAAGTVLREVVAGAGGRPVW